MGNLRIIYPIFNHIKEDSAISFRGPVKDKILQYELRNDGGVQNILVSTIIRRKDMMLWESCLDLLKGVLVLAEMKVSGIDDLDARVVRSTSGTIRIPELGVDIEPGPASNSFISNIEGVLDRVIEILEMVVRWGEDDKTPRAQELLYTIEKIMAGECEITLIIDDPLGNSAIIANKAISRELTEEEVKYLKCGMIIFEK